MVPQQDLIHSEVIPDDASLPSREDLELPSKADSKQAFLTFFKSLFGAGLLSLPNVLGAVGLPLGVLLYSLVAACCTLTCFFLLRARHMAEKHLQSTNQHTHTRLTTYADLAQILYGDKMALLVQGVIVILHILFTTGLVIVILENLSDLISVNDWFWYSSLLLLIMGLLQIAWLQDMWIISALGLLVYSVGVIGSTIYSAASDPNPPSDIWKFKASAAPSFIGSAVYALEGINLALPTVHSMQKQQDGVKVVCWAVVMYAVLTLLFGAIGYAGGLGGGPDTLYSRAECDVVTRCISPQTLQTLLRVALSIAMLLSVPVMLFPATEMLEVAITELRVRVRQRRERKKQRKLSRQQPLPPYKSSQSPSDMLLETQNDIPDAAQASTTELQQQQLPSHVTAPDTWYHSLEEKLASIDDDGLHTAASIHVIEKSWRLRVGLAVWILGLAIAVPSFTLFSALVGAVGLSFAGFILPCLLYLKGLQVTHEPIRYPTLTVTGFLMAFGLYNMTVGGWSAFKDVLGGVLED